MFFSTVNSKQFKRFGPQNCQTQVYSRSQNKQRRGNIVWTSSHDMIAHIEQYQYGTVGNVLLFQSQAALTISRHTEFFLKEIKVLKF